MFDNATVTMSLRDYNQLQNEIEQRGFWYDRLALRIREAIEVRYEGNFFNRKLILTAVDEQKLLEIVKDLIEEEDL